MRGHVRGARPRRRPALVPDALSSLAQPDRSSPEAQRPGQNGVLESVESPFDQARGGLLTVATACALVTLSGAFAVVINALNIAYDTVERRSWLRRRLLGLLMGVVTLAVAAFALAAVIIGPFLGRGTALADRWGLSGPFTWAWEVLRLRLLALGVVAWTATLFHYAPSRCTRWRDAVPGAVLTTSLRLAAPAGFHLYLRVVAGGNPDLGAFGGGAIVCATRRLHRGCEPVGQAPGWPHAIHPGGPRRSPRPTAGR